MFANLVPGKPEAGVTYFRGEAEKAFAMLDRWLATRSYLVGETYTIADISAYPMAITSAQNLPAGITPYPHIQRWAERIGARPAVQRGMKLFS